jgi:hypothetical protein
VRERPSSSKNSAAWHQQEKDSGIKLCIACCPHLSVGREEEDLMLLYKDVVIIFGDMCGMDQEDFSIYMIRLFIMQDFLHG